MHWRPRHCHTHYSQFAKSAPSVGKPSVTLRDYSSLMRSKCYLCIDGEITFQCVEHECNIIELDVRTSKDGKLLLLHDQGLERLAGTSISDVRAVDWDKIKDVDVGATHPNRLVGFLIDLLVKTVLVLFLWETSVTMSEQFPYISDNYYIQYLKKTLTDP